MEVEVVDWVKDWGLEMGWEVAMEVGLAVGVACSSMIVLVAPLACSRTPHTYLRMPSSRLMTYTQCPLGTLLVVVLCS